MRCAFSRFGGLALVCVLMMWGCAGMEGGFAHRDGNFAAPSSGVAREARPSADDLPEARAAVPVSHEEPQPQTPSERILIYDASLGLVVADIRQTMQAILDLGQTLGGHLQQMDQRNITLRVPADQFHEAVARIERLGEITDRNVRGQDITEEMIDLRLRLETARQMRQRLVDLLDRAESVEDTLKIERELSRIVGEIERMQGRIRYLTDRAALSTITVTLNSPLPQRQVAAQIPFEWVRKLGDGAVTGRIQPEADTRRWGRAINFTLPPNYIRYYNRQGVAEVMGADGILMKIQSHDNYEGGSAAFWTALVRRALTENRAMAVQSVESLALDRQRSAEAAWIVADRDLGTEQQMYALALIVTDRRVHTLEAWGPVDAMRRDLPAIRAAARSLQIR
ncbi:MAG: DUF4349 domain-containing protein [Phycisphaeraceae bacterium]|nr:DUF4349 domain-containing protein [Phycisphaeraceae bacterium]